ncbi:MAG: ATP-dependent DNA helicase RecG [Verrucomicrobiota bacterium]
MIAKLSYASPEALLRHYPRRHEDRARWVDPFAVAVGEYVTVLGKITKHKFARWRGRGCCLEVWIQPEGKFDTLKLVWFGIPYLKTHMTEGKRLIVYGKITEGKKERQIQHPEFEFIKEDEDALIHLNRITPIYPLTEGVSQRVLRREIFSLLQEEEIQIPETYALPKGFMNYSESARKIHFPENWAELESARKSLVFDELFRMQLVLTLRKYLVKRVVKERGEKKCELVEKFQKSFPFEMTGAQKKVCAEIDGDLEKKHPMNRLLQGDVGSGKTMVAVCALLRTLERGMNGALLAPTEILAEQHFLNLKRWLEPLEVQVELWTRTRKPSLSDSLFGKNGKIFIGTHALIQEKTALPNLGLGVIDEQHKFGVLQRAAFLQKGEHPDLLVMTATPIPRTLCLTLYGDLDVSTLDEMPPGRGKMRTFLRGEEKLPQIWDFVKKEISAGRQAYVVYPLIEDSEKVNWKAVENEAKKLREFFGEHHLGVLHGKMDAEEKEKIMREFREKKFSVLVATTVIEVGVDIPNATVMVIENAERFGLAQLHQLRGRVGRGKHESYCILVGKATSAESWRRLKIMEETEDGFRLAEEDLKIRGPGDVIGTEQSGLPPLRMADLSKDWNLLLKARDYAQEFLKNDPNLKKYSELRQELKSAFSIGLAPTVN